MREAGLNRLSLGKIPDLPAMPIYDTDLVFFSGYVSTLGVGTGVSCPGGKRRRFDVFFDPVGDVCLGVGINSMTTLRSLTHKALQP